MNPSDLRYSREHEWVRLESDTLAVVGITQFATENLGDVVFVDLPEVGTQLAQFQKMGEIESVKAVSDLFSPISGRVLERNECLVDSPELVEQGPYEQGWMVKLEIGDASELDKLMTVQAYDSFLDSQEH